MKIVIPKSDKKRVVQHLVLWDRELPFRPKIERSKKAYKRRPKHNGDKFDSSGT